MMTIPHRNLKIRPDHLERPAFVYVRQSTLFQVRENTASTARQYDLVQRAENLGWSKPSITVIDQDQGCSGSSAVDRDGFQFLIAQVGLGQAGAVLSLEASRLARSCSDWYRLLEVCALTDTLVIDEDGVYDPSQYADRLLLGILGTMSEAELHWLRNRLLGGKLARAEQWATSKKVFRDYQAHVEFRDPFMPFARGQGRANSGVYLDQCNKNSRPGYEIQVLDSFGLDGKIDECGAVYGQKAPLLNMCYPPLSWQTYDIQFKAARWNKDRTKAASPVLTVHHNGVKIHDNIELQENYLTGGEKSLADKPGALMLQNYVGKVYYRNIWVVEKP
jgi:DNA invertase Pin-like site-specific DNA recombinase